MKLSLVLSQYKQKDNRYSILVRIYSNNKIAYVKTGFTAKKSELLKNKISNRHPKHSAINETIETINNKARKYILEYPLANAKQIRDYITGKSIKPLQLDFYSFSEEFIETYDNPGTKETFSKTLSKLKSFKPDLSINDIDYSLLSDFERYCKTERGNSNSTINKNMRHIRRIYNEIIKRSPSDLKRRLRNNNPFEEYKLPTPEKSIKVALSIEEINKIKSLNLKGFKEVSRDIFLFQIYAEGCRISDALNMRFDQIKENQITYKPIKGNSSYKSVYITDPLREIIDKYKSKRKLIFPILKSKGYKEFKNFVYMIKGELKQISLDAGIDKKITTHCARHTFALLMDQSNAPLNVIRNSLGHSKASSTDHYLKQLRNDNNSEYLKQIFE